MNLNIIEIIENNDPKRAAEIINAIIESKERLIWFLKNIGKTVYPDALTCKCYFCTKNLTDGILIHSGLVAFDLYNTEMDLSADGNPIKFYLSKEERDRIFDERNNAIQILLK